MRKWERAGIVLTVPAGKEIEIPMANIEMKIEGLPTGFTLRRPTMDDMAAVKHLLNLCEVAEYGRAETTEDDMRLWWQRPNFDLATSAWIVFAPDGQAIGGQHGNPDATLDAKTIFLRARQNAV